MHVDKKFEVAICTRCKRIRRYPVGGSMPTACGFQKDEDTAVCCGKFRAMTNMDKCREARRWFFLPKECRE